jgi:hypothetical protein
VGVVHGHGCRTTTIFPRSDECRMKNGHLADAVPKLVGYGSLLGSVTCSHRPYHPPKPPPGGFSPALRAPRMAQEGFRARS